MPAGKCWKSFKYDFSDKDLREALKIHFGGQANLFVAGLRQAKATLSTDKADLPSLPDNKNFLLAAQKQLLELPLRNCQKMQTFLIAVEGIGNVYSR